MLFSLPKIVTIPAVALVASLAFFATGCQSACKAAGSKIGDCFPNDGTNPAPPPGTPTGDPQAEECSGRNECLAKCANDASCDEIKAAFTGSQNSYTQCAQACEGGGV